MYFLIHFRQKLYIYMMKFVVFVKSVGNPQRKTTSKLESTHSETSDLDYFTESARQLDVMTNDSHGRLVIAWCLRLVLVCRRCVHGRFELLLQYFG